MRPQANIEHPLDGTPIILRDLPTFLARLTKSFSSVARLNSFADFDGAMNFGTPRPDHRTRLSRLACAELSRGGGAMKNDTKLGLVIGLGIVLAVAVTYYPKSASGKPSSANVVPSLPSGQAER